MLDATLHEIAQANFLKTVGTVLPNARIDFQVDSMSQMKPPPPPPPLPPDAKPSCVSSDVLPSDCSTDSNVESMGSLHLPAEQWESPVSTAGTPEWTPRHTSLEQPQQAAIATSDPELLPQQALLQEVEYQEAYMSVASEHCPPQHAPQSTPAWGTSMCCGDSGVHNLYRVAYLGGIELRVQPSYLAARSGAILHQNEVFAASAEIVGADGRVYLRLADGRGWAFDDSALLPHDPSVVRGHFASAHLEATPEPVSPACPYSGTALQLEPAVATGLVASQFHCAEPYLTVQQAPLAQAPPNADMDQHFGAAPILQAEVISHMVSTSLHHTAADLEPCLESTSLPQAAAQHVDYSQTWTNMAHNYSAWTPGNVFSQPVVTSDCPPTWEPTIGPPVKQQWHSKEWS